MTIKDVTGHVLLKGEAEKRIPEGVMASVIGYEYSPRCHLYAWEVNNSEIYGMYVDFKSDKDKFFKEKRLDDLLRFVRSYWGEDAGVSRLMGEVGGKVRIIVRCPVVALEVS